MNLGIMNFEDSEKLLEQRSKTNLHSRDEFLIMLKIGENNNIKGYAVAIRNDIDYIAKVIALNKNIVFSLAKQGKVVNAIVKGNKLRGKGINLDEMPISNPISFIDALKSDEEMLVIK